MKKTTMKNLMNSSEILGHDREHKENSENSLANISKIFGSTQLVEDSKPVVLEFLNLPPEKIALFMPDFLRFPETPYFYFYKARYYEVLIDLLLVTVITNTDKISIIELLVDNYELPKTFQDITAVYDRLDRFRIDTVVFRNYVLEKILRKLILSLDISSVINGFSEISDDIERTESFADFLVSKASTTASGVIILFFVYNWLISIPVDINKVKEAKEIEGTINDKFIGKIFQVYPLLYKGILSDGGKEEEDEEFLEKLQQLYSSKDLRGIILSTYKRLFYFFTVKNKKRFYSIKVLKCFKAEEQHMIYLRLRDNQKALVNVFSQINRNYLMHELTRTKSKYLLENIGQVTPASLGTFYRNYFSALLGGEKDEIRISVENSSVFSREFNLLSLAQKTELLSVLEPVIQKKVTLDLNDNATVYMLTFFKGIELDIVELVSVVLDFPSRLIDPQCLFYNTNILKLILHRKEKLFSNKPLLSRFSSVLKQLLNFRVYLPVAGELFNAFYVIDGDFTAYEFSRIILYGAINHPEFLSLYMASEGGNETCGSNISIHRYARMDCSFADDNDVAYLLYAKYQARADEKEIARIIKLNIPETNKLGLEFVYFYKHKLSFEFVNRNLSIFYDLLFYEPDLVTAIFIDALKNKQVVPVTVIPHLIIFLDSQFLHRNYLDTCLNSIGKSLTIITSRIFNEISLRSVDGEMDEESLVSIVSHFTANLFISNIYPYTSIYKLISAIPVKDDLFSLFIILRNLKKMKKDDMEKVYKHLEENVHDDKLLDFIELYRLRSRRCKEDPDCKILIDFI